MEWTVDKRYQVFVSSTYADLQQERQHVIQTLMEMDCIPAGMELFPAADEEQWEFIKRVIDDCDYYLLVIGGRYGSLTPDGISYTEKEYEYAKSIGLKVIAFVHGRPDAITVEKSDVDPELREKLNLFRDSVSAGRLVKYWSSAAELPGLVALSLSKAIKVYPAVGWVRARDLAGDDLLADLNQLRKQNEVLRSRISELESQQVPADLNLAPLDEAFVLGLKWVSRGKYRHTKRESIQATWAEIFVAIAAEMVDTPSDSLANARMAAALYRSKIGEDEAPSRVSIQHDDFQTIRLQLVTLRLVDVKTSKTTTGGTAVFWSLTKAGQSLLAKTRTVRSANLG